MVRLEPLLTSDKNSEAYTMSATCSWVSLFSAKGI
jgi:hypothetical protein